MSDEAKTEAEPKKGTRRSKLIAMVALAVLLLALGAGAAVYQLGFLGGDGAAEAAQADGLPPLDDAKPQDIVFITLPDLLVNLEVNGKRLRFLKFTAALEVVGKDQATIVEQFVPRVADNIHLYLRALQLEDLSGAAGVYRVKRDLLTRVNQVVKPARVRDVLIREMLVQ